MTLGSAAAAHVRYLVWHRECRHQVEPDPVQRAQRYGAEMPVPERGSSLFAPNASRAVDMVVTGTER
jgi:hypothetical protein